MKQQRQQTGPKEIRQNEDQSKATALSASAMKLTQAEGVTPARERASGISEGNFGELRPSSEQVRMEQMLGPDMPSEGYSRFGACSYWPSRIIHWFLNYHSRFMFGGLI